MTASSWRSPRAGRSKREVGTPALACLLSLTGGIIFLARYARPMDGLCIIADGDGLQFVKMTSETEYDGLVDFPIGPMTGMWLSGHQRALNLTNFIESPFSGAA